MTIPVVAQDLTSYFTFGITVTYFRLWGGRPLLMAAHT
jgi:hypothetical protein